MKFFLPGGLSLESKPLRKNLIPLAAETRSVEPETSRQRCSGVRRNSSGLSRKVQSAEGTARTGTERTAASSQFFMDSPPRVFLKIYQPSKRTTNFSAHGGFAQKALFCAILSCRRGLFF